MRHVGIFLLVISVLGFSYAWIAEQQVALELKEQEDSGTVEHLYPAAGLRDASSRSRGVLQYYQTIYRSMMWGVGGLFLIGLLLSIAACMRGRKAPKDGSLHSESADQK